MLHSAACELCLISIDLVGLKLVEPNAQLSQAHKFVWHISTQAKKKINKPDRFWDDAHQDRIIMEMMRSQMPGHL